MQSKTQEVAKLMKNGQILFLKNGEAAFGDKLI